MITEEMIKEAAKAIAREMHSKGNLNPHPDFYGDEKTYVKNTETAHFNFVKTALTAIYPLILKQVLEEAAKACDRRKEFYEAMGINTRNLYCQIANDMRKLKEAK